MMGMSTYVVGLMPPDEHYLKMYAAWSACDDAGIEPPKEVVDFFGGGIPDPGGAQVEIKDAVTESTDDDEEHYEIDLSKLPDGVRAIRFTNSW